MLPRNPDGTFPLYTSVGSYPIFYLDRRDNVLCADCANESEGDDAVVAAGCNWDDPHLHCDECGERIDSAYAEDDSE